MNDTIASPHPSPSTSETAASPATRRWRPRSVVLIVLFWLVLHIGGLFTPGLLDDVDSVYLEIARQMLVRHDYVTPYIDGIRFFDKPPLMYWLAAASMRVFGPHDWAGRLPLALLTLGLLLSTYALALRLFGGDSTRSQATGINPDRAALYSALALATCIGPYLYTRFYIPDVPVALFLTVAIHAFLVALDRIRSAQRPAPSNSSLLPSLIFAAVTALNVLSKGLIGLVFPIVFAFFYLAITKQLRLLPKFHLIPSTLAFLVIAAPWHILAALRNPPIAMPGGLGMPARAGWAWFYLYNEHIARFLSKRIPHDYGQVPIPLFWLLAAIWIFPWLAFLPDAIRAAIGRLRNAAQRGGLTANSAEAPLVLLLWTALILGFFTISARQEYYSLPCLPALALMAGSLLATADTDPSSYPAKSALFWHKWLLVPIGSFAAAVALFFVITAPHVDPNTDIALLLIQGGGDYNLSLSHLFDLTGRAMGLFRIPLICFGISMAAGGPGTYLLRRRGQTCRANLALAAASASLLLCMHAGLVRFYPTLGSKSLAEAILVEQAAHPASDDIIIIDGELTSGSTLLFYTHQPAHLVNGRINGPWFGSFWPDAPHIFETDESLRRQWSGPQRIFLLTYHADTRTPDLARFGAVNVLASSGGKAILVNRP